MLFLAEQVRLRCCPNSSMRTRPRPRPNNLHCPESMGTAWIGLRCYCNQMRHADCRPVWRVQYIEPTIRNSIKPMQELNWIILVERVLKLCIPTLYIWLAMFYTLFHVWLNILAELMCFGDREFYKVGTITFAATAREGICPASQAAPETHAGSRALGAWPLAHSSSSAAMRIQSRTCCPWQCMRAESVRVSDQYPAFPAACCDDRSSVDAYLLVSSAPPMKLNSNLHLKIHRPTFYQTSISLELSRIGRCVFPL